MPKAPTPRDYVYEMRHVIDDATSGDEPYVRRTVAEKIVARLRGHDPDLLDGWLHNQAANFVYHAIGDIDRSKRASAQFNRNRTTFREAAAHFNAQQRGETLHRPPPRRTIPDYLSHPYQRADGTSLRLGLLYAADLHFIADDYEERERQNAFRKTVMRTLAKKIGKDKVEDRYTNAQLHAMFHPGG